VGPAYAAPLQSTCRASKCLAAVAGVAPDRQQFSASRGVGRAATPGRRSYPGPRVEPLPHRRCQAFSPTTARPSTKRPVGVAPSQHPILRAAFVGRQRGVRSFVLTPQSRPPPGWWRVRAMPPRRWRWTPPTNPRSVNHRLPSSLRRRPVVSPAPLGGVTKGRGPRPDERHVRTPSCRRVTASVMDPTPCRPNASRRGRCWGCEPGTGWSRPTAASSLRQRGLSLARRRWSAEPAPWL